VNLVQQAEYVADFYRQSVGIIVNRQSDYAPDGVVLLNVLQSCVDWQMSVFQVLGVLLDKQCTALQRYCAVQQLDSDPPHSRLRDAANYFAFFGMYLDRREQIHHAWTLHWTAQTCPTLLEPGTECRRCKTLAWLRQNAPAR